MTDSHPPHSIGLRRGTIITAAAIALLIILVEPALAQQSTPGDPNAYIKGLGDRIFKLVHNAAVAAATISIVYYLGMIAIKGANQRYLVRGGISVLATMLLLAFPRVMAGIRTVAKPGTITAPEAVHIVGLTAHLPALGLS